MKSLLKKRTALLLGLGVLTTAISPAIAAVNMDPENGKIKVATITQEEIDNLLEIYKPQVQSSHTHLNVKIYNEHDHLIYSDKVELSKIDTDLRLSALLNGSDYITEIDNTKIYKLK